MPAPGTQFAGPLISGPKQYAEGSKNPNTGLAILSQSAVLNQAGASTNVSYTFNLPPRSQILNIYVDPITQWDSAASAGLTVGSAALGTQYVSSVNVKTATSRSNVAPTAAQIAAMSNIGANTDVVATVAVSGATSAGSTRVSIQYVQTPDWMQP